MTLANPLSALDGLIGLEEVRHRLTDLRNLLKLEQESQRRGWPTPLVSLHAFLIGSPGTGKTEVAKAIAHIYRQLGILTGPFIHCSATDLVAAYIGQTAFKARKKIEETIGGVLLIDEAHLLADEKTFGMEALHELLNFMTDDRDKLAVLFAGYPKPMEKFFQMNEGLSRHYPRRIYMPEYSDDQLVEILEVRARAAGTTIADDARPVIREKLTTHRSNCAAARLSFGFVRDAGNLLNKARLAHAQRLSDRSMHSISDEELSTLTAGDFYAAELGVP